MRIPQVPEGAQNHPGMNKVNQSGLSDTLSGGSIISKEGATAQTQHTQRQSTSPFPPFLNVPVLISLLPSPPLLPAAGHAEAQWAPHACTAGAGAGAAADAARSHRSRFGRAHRPQQPAGNVEA